MDVMKLMMSDYKVEMVNDGMCEFYVEFAGPKESPYEGGLWKVHVELPEAYPYKSPSIGFVNRIFHPNVDEMAGSVCLDVINQTWSPMFGTQRTTRPPPPTGQARALSAPLTPEAGGRADLINVFEVFLPQLLLYPNPTDPLNGEAAALLMREPEQYTLKVKEYCAKYARAEDISMKGVRDESESGGDDGSDDGNFLSSDDEDAAANADL